MYLTNTLILEKNIDDNLKSDHILVMTYVKNH